jgi:hypothetical protein
MKTVFEQGFGGDGAKAGLYVTDDAMLEVAVKYPLAKILQPATDVVDATFTKIEEAIPGDWDKAILEPIKEELKAQLLKLVQG